MTPEIIAPIALVALGAVVIIYTRLIAPRGARRRISLSLTRRGWMKVPPDRDYMWTNIMTLAVEDHHGASQIREYDRAIGPFAVHVKRTEKRSGKALEVVASRYGVSNVALAKTCRKLAVPFRRGATGLKSRPDGRRPRVRPVAARLIVNKFKEL